MKRVEAATCERRRGERLATHDGTAFCEVISEAAWRNDVCHQAMERKTVRWSRELTRCIVGLQVDHDRGGFAHHIGQGFFIRDRHTGSRVRANPKQSRGKAGIDEPRNTSALECVLFKDRAGHPKAQSSPVWV